MNFEPILNYLRVEENNTLKVHEEEYSKIQEEYIKNEDEIRSHENGLKETINDTVVYQQKSY